MLSLDDIRNRKEIVVDTLRKRFMDDLIPVVERIERADMEWREILKELNSLRSEKNKIAKEIGNLVRDGKDFSNLKKRSKEIDEKIKVLEEKEKNLTREIKQNLSLLPNFIHPDIPIGPDDSYNKPIRYWGVPKVLREHVTAFVEENKDVEYDVVDVTYHHYDLTEKYCLADTERAAKTSGSRFYFERDAIVFLDIALAIFALEFLKRKGFVPILPPYAMRRFVEESATYFTDFEDVIYKIEGEDLYLIPTSEHALLGYHAGEIFESGELPRRYAGWSACFRKEAGAHGKDTKGIFRVHQFNKVEQFSYTYPEDSWEEHEFLIRNAEEIVRKLELPYRVVDIASGDLGPVAARKYDIEVWFPGQGKYREVVSASNCLSWQARRANIRYRRKDGKTDFVHTLNSTALAHQRIICAILENHFDGDVVRIPDVLHRYLPEEYRSIELRTSEE